MKHLISSLSAILFNGVVGATFGTILGLDPLLSVGVANLFGALLGFFPASGVLRAGVLKELWTGELVKALRGRLESSWLDGIPDASSVAENDVLHLVDVGVDPDVLINNTTYPIPEQALDDKDLTISLNKFQTKVTPVTDDELYALSYDKMARVKDSHANALTDAKFKKSAHSFCAQRHAKATPVLKTSGEKVTETGRKRMTIKDVLAMKAAMDDNHVPAENRRLVLCTDHVNDLLGTDQNFREQYNINRTDGTIARLYGFTIYEFANTPIYAKTGEKKAVDATAEAGEFQCSFAFYTPRVFKCTGSTKMYYSEAATDPAHQKNRINFRHYFIAMPKKPDAGCVMMSAHEG